MQTISELLYRKFLRRGGDGSRADGARFDSIRCFSDQEIPFGKLVFYAGRPHSCKLPDGSDPLKYQLGIAQFKQAIDEMVVFNPPQPLAYPLGSPIDVVTYSRLIIFPEDQPKMGDPVFFRSRYLDPNGQNQVDLIRFSDVPNAGACQIAIEEGPQTFPGGVMSAPFTALDLQNAMNAVGTLPFPVTATVTGDPINGFVLDWGASSQQAVFKLVLLTNYLTKNSILVSSNYTNLLPGYPAGTRYGVGSFRTTDDFGSCQNANGPGAARKFQWYQATDSDGAAILEIS